MALAPTTSAANPPATLNEMYQKAAIAINADQAKLDKLEHPGFFGAIKDKITFQSKKRQQQADALRQAMQQISQMMQQIAQQIEQANSH